MKQVKISEAKATLKKLIVAVSKGEEIILMQGGKPVAKLVKFESEKVPRDLSPAPWATEVVISDSFDQLPEDFLAYFSKPTSSQ